MAIPAITSRTRPTVINLRSRHRLPVLEVTACFPAAGPSGAGNDLGGADCPSILFNALRMELKMTILQNCVGFAKFFWPTIESDKASQTFFFLDRE